MTFPEETSDKTEDLTAEAPKAGAPEDSASESPEGISAEAVPEVPQAPEAAAEEVSEEAAEAPEEATGKETPAPPKDAPETGILPSAPAPKPKKAKVKKSRNCVAGSIRSSHAAPRTTSATAGRFPTATSAYSPGSASRSPRSFF